MSGPPTIRTRFAPSPSGHLHVGGARTALFCWAYARRHEGRFMLRIEDTDRKRSSDAASTGFLEDLAWLGIDWDEGPEWEGRGGGAHGPYRQSERLSIYDEHIARLLAEGKAYRAFEAPEELDAQRAAARAEKRNWRYDRAALALDADTVARYVAEARPHVVRLHVPDDREIVIEDLVRGTVTVSTNELDDFVIVKADGWPTYHLAVVIDDETMGVSHVIRAQEHLSNTPKHILIQEALGFSRPVYAHVSIIQNPDGSKMSKRDKDKALRRTVRERGLETCEAIDDGSFRAWLGAKDRQLDLPDAERLAAELGIELPEIDVDDFRRHGYLPEVLINYLALLGWSPGGDVEQFDRAYLFEHFDLDRMIKSPATFDRAKLRAFNHDAIQAITADEFVARFRAHCASEHPEFLERLSDDAFRTLAEANQARSKTLDDTIASSRFFVIDDEAVTYEDSKPVRKALLKGDTTGCAHLEALRPTLAAIDDWTIPAIEAAVTAYADAQADGKLGSVAQPLRVAVSGGTISPAIFDTLAILGRESVLARIDRCLAHFAAGAGC